MTGRNATDAWCTFARRGYGDVDRGMPTRGITWRQLPNWLATPSGRFKLMLRVYLPGAAIVDGAYRVPPVVEERA
ncbi:MAG: hypothetical protein QM713_17355 [Arachnia sp.]